MSSSLLGAGDTEPKKWLVLSSCFRAGIRHTRALGFCVVYTSMILSFGVPVHWWDPSVVVVLWVMLPTIAQISKSLENFLWINKLWYMYSYLPNNVTRPLRFQRSKRIRDSYRWEAGNCSWLSQNSLHNLKLSMDNPVTPVVHQFYQSIQLIQSKWWIDLSQAQP